MQMEIKKSVIAYEPRKDGEDIHTTIDGDLQSTLYEQFKEDRGCSVALNPYTGEVLALVSTHLMIIMILYVEWTTASGVH